MRPLARLLASTLFAAALHVGDAGAAQPPAPKAQPAAPIAAHTETRTEKDPLPDYDGRGREPAGPGETLLWIPRIALLPAYVLSEYAVRRPLGFLVTTAEKNRWHARLYDFFTFGDDHQAGVVPTALFDFGLRPSVGLYFFWDRAFAERNAIRFHTATWGRDWITATLTDRVTLDARTTFAMRGEITRRSDGVFHGIGPNADAGRTRFSSTLMQVGPQLLVGLGGASELGAQVQLRRMTFRDGGCCENPTLDEGVERGFFPPPPGWGEAYTLVTQRLELALDSRAPRPSPGSGVRLELHADPAVDVSGPRRSWVRFGGSIGGSLDLNHKQRVVSLTVGAEMVEPLQKDAVIPFTEQVRLGGTGPMRGFLPGRLVGRSAATASLQYTWPIWVFLDGELHASVGNVFGERLEGFALRDTRLSTGIGVRTNSRRDHALQILVAVGTNTFAHGAGVDTVRVLVGTTRGF